MKTSTLLSKALISALSAGLLATFAVAEAQTAPAPAKTWKQEHPRRAEVVGRSRHLDRRIARQRKAGDISAAQARADRQDVNSTRTEQKDMAQTNGGYITKDQQKALNQQDNAVAKQLGQ